MQPDALALAVCCRVAMAAANGHGRRWALARCSAALRRNEVTPASDAINDQCARAMVAIAGVINRRAAQANVSPLKPGA